MKAGQTQNYALMLLRIVVAVLILVHGVARIYLGIVDDLGVFLTAKGFPLGFYFAWAITAFEIVGSVLLIIGRYILPLSMVFAAHLFAGILLVHLKDGWFVVGAGKNGVEYSILLITVFITLALTHFDKAKN